MKSNGKTQFILLILILGIGFPSAAFGKDSNFDNEVFLDGFNNNLDIAELTISAASTKSTEEKKVLADRLVEAKTIKKNRRSGNGKRRKKTPRTQPEDRFKVEVAKKKKKNKKRHPRPRVKTIVKHRKDGDYRKSQIAARNEYYIGIPLENLTSKQRNSLRRKLERLLTKKTVIAFLNSIQWAEGGQPTLPVGGYSNNGLGKKPRYCMEKISNLDLSGHPKEQKLPTPCFYYNKNVGMWSFAAGNLQVTFTNWKHFKDLFKFKTFAEKNQAIAGLELVRTSATRGNRIGDGLIALLNNDIDGAIMKGSDPWASSPYSRHKGAKKNNLMQYTKRELQNLEKNELYAKRQLNRYNNDKNS